jgi:predicted RNase H-like nuclease (RuvC/YqgF family)
MDDFNPRIEDAMKTFERLQKMKADVVNNKLNNRNDVQVLKRKIARLNQELIYSKQDMERAEEIFNKTTKTYHKQKLEHGQYVAHLTIISKNHRQHQEEQLRKLMSAMKIPQPPPKPLESAVDSKLPPTVDHHCPQDECTTASDALQ